MGIVYCPNRANFVKSLIFAVSWVPAIRHICTVKVDEVKRLAICLRSDRMRDNNIRILTWDRTYLIKRWQLVVENFLVCQILLCKDLVDRNHDWFWSYQAGWRDCIQSKRQSACLLQTLVSYKLRLNTYCESRDCLHCLSAPSHYLWSWVKSNEWGTWACRVTRNWHRVCIIGINTWKWIFSKSPNCNLAVCQGVDVVFVYLNWVTYWDTGFSWIDARGRLSIECDRTGSGPSTSRNYCRCDRDRIAGVISNVV